MTRVCTGDFKISEHDADELPVRRPRRHHIRTALTALVLVAVIAGAAQLGGVGGTNGRHGATLVFDGTHESWLIKSGAARRSRLEAATRTLGGGKVSGTLPGGWREVHLSDHVAQADVEHALADSGVEQVEPVQARTPYDVAATTPQPSSHEDAAPAPTAPQPSSHNDPAAAIGSPTTGKSLRAAVLAAPRLSSQWDLSQASDHDINAPEAWARSTGQGIVVAVIDTGVDAQHPDLAGHVLPGQDFSGSATGADVDKVGHGTAIASIIAGNGSQMAGVAPDVQIMPLKVYRDSASAFSMSGYLNAIRYAVDNGANIINISLGCGGTTSCYSQAELDALTYANDHNVLVVAAAGNGTAAGTGMDNDSADTPDFPSGYDLPNIVSVTSSNKAGEWSPWSNYGAQNVDMAAPGEDILAAAPAGSFRILSGTSFAAPLVSGAAALVLGVDHTVTASDLRARLVASVKPHPTLTDRTLSGGSLNASSALLQPSTAALGGGPTTAALRAPVNGAKLGVPPVLSWTLPTGWTSAQLVLRGPGGSFDRPLAAAARAASHPATAWLSGTYRWQIVARRLDGTTVRTAPRTYTIAPRLAAWVTSGRVTPSGNDVQLRIGYAASERTARVRIRVLAGTRVLHTGRAQARTAHVHGPGSPRRGWFGYRAHLSRSVRVGERITVEVRVESAGASLTRRFRATVR